MSLYTISLNGEFLMLCRACHVDSVIDDLELQGFDISDVTWDERSKTVELLTTDSEG